jgi:hypothetical protein
LESGILISTGPSKKVPVVDKVSVKPSRLLKEQRLATIGALAEKIENPGFPEIGPVTYPAEVAPRKNFQ